MNYVSDHELSKYLGDEIVRIRTSLENLLKSIGDLRGEFAKRQDVEELHKRLASLEESRARVIGAAFILNLVGGAVIIVVNKLWK